MKSRKRISFALAALGLIAVEVLIALFVNDRFVRPYIGDVLVTVVIWALARTAFPEKVRLLALYVFAFAAGVEILQYFDIVGLLGLENNRFFSILIGSTFDVKDIICYAAGCIIALFIDTAVAVKEKSLSKDNADIK